MAQWVQVLAAKCYLTSLILRPTWQKERTVFTSCPYPLHVLMAHASHHTHVCTHTCAYTHRSENVSFKKKESLNLPFSLLQDFVFFFISPKFQG